MGIRGGYFSKVFSLSDMTTLVRQSSGFWRRINHTVMKLAVATFHLHHTKFDARVGQSLSCFICSAWINSDWAPSSCTWWTRWMCVTVVWMRSVHKVRLTLSRSSLFNDIPDFALKIQSNSNKILLDNWACQVKKEICAFVIDLRVYASSDHLGLACWVGYESVGELIL